MDLYAPLPVSSVAPDPGGEAAPLWRRAVAWIVDRALFYGPILVALVVSASSLAIWFTFVWALMLLVIQANLLPGGETVGLRLLRLKVVKRDSRGFGLAQAVFIRFAAVYAMDLVIMLLTCGIVSFFVSGVNVACALLPGRRCLADRLLGLVVVVSTETAAP